MQNNSQLSIENTQQQLQQDLKQYFLKFHSIILDCNTMKQLKTLKDLKFGSKQLPEYLKIYDTYSSNIIAIYLLDFIAVVQSVQNKLNSTDSIETALFDCTLASCYKVLVKGADVYRNKLIVKRLYNAKKLLLPK